MIEIFFCVENELKNGEAFGIVGSIDKLGSWSTQKAIMLHSKKERWESLAIQVQADKSFQFKIIKQSSNSIEWQNFANNSNRRFKSKHSVRLYLQWNKPEGKVSKFSNNKKKKFSIKESSSDQKSSVKLIKDQNFDPYTRAYYSHSSDDEEGELVIKKRKISDDLSTTNIDFEDLFYKTQPFQLLYSLTKKNKIYVISREINLQTEFHKEIQAKIKQLNHHYTSKWMTVQTLKNQKINKSKCNVKSIQTMFEIEEEEILDQNIYSPTTYFIILDIESALALKSQLSQLSTCLYLPFTQFQQVKKVVKQLPKCELICFDRQQQNKIFAQFLQQARIFLFQISHASLLKNQVPSFEQLVQMLQCSKKKDNLIIDNLGSLKQQLAIEAFMKSNSITFIEGGMIERCSEFVQKLLKRKKEKSLFVFVIKEDHLCQRALKIKEYRNVVIIYNSFKSIIIENNEYHPLRKFQQIIDLFRMKMKLLIQQNGGEIVEKSSSLSYFVPENKAELAAKIYTDFKTNAKCQSFIKVTRKGKKIKVVWNIAEQARAVRTLCEIKYTNFGKLGNFNIVSDLLTLRQFKENFKLLVNHHPKLFQSPKNTKINYYSYGGKVMATCHILPEQIEEDQDQVFE